MLLPYSADLGLRRIPFVTLGIMLLCLAVFMAQEESHAVHRQALEESCNNIGDVALRMALQRWNAERSEQRACAEIVERLRQAAEPQQELEVVMRELHQRYRSGIRGEAEYVQSGIEGLYRKYRARNAVPELTTRLWYEPRGWEPLRMLTAAVAHGGWGHLLGNLLYFWIFAGAVELLLGWWRYGLFCIAMALGTHIAYSLVNLKIAAPPTLGLSGVVYAVMALFACLLPQIRIKLFFWFIVGYRVLRVPVWLFAGWYIGVDLYNLRNDAGGGVNFVAHVSGALLAIAAALLFFRRQMREGRDVDAG